MPPTSQRMEQDECPQCAKIWADAKAEYEAGGDPQSPPARCTHGYVAPPIHMCPIHNMSFENCPCDGTEQDTTAEDMLRVMTSRQYAVFKEALNEGREGPEPVDVLRSDLLDLLRELIALRAKPAAMDGESREAFEVAVKRMRPNIVLDRAPDNRGNGDAYKFVEASDFWGFWKTARADIPHLVAQVESLRAANAKMRDALELCREDGEQQAKADAPGVHPDWYSDVVEALAPPSPAPDAEGKR